MFIITLVIFLCTKKEYILTEICLLLFIHIICGVLKMFESYILKKKSISSIIIIVLLILVCLVLIYLVLNFGKNITTKSLYEANDFKEKYGIDTLTMFKLELFNNNHLILKNLYSDGPVTIVGYKIVSDSVGPLLNKFNSLKEPVVIDEGYKQVIDIVQPPDRKFTIQLLTDKDKYITINNIPNFNKNTFAKIYGSNVNEQAVEVVQTNDGGYAFLYYNYNDSIFLIKLDSSGNQDWNYNYGFGDHDHSAIDLLYNSDGYFGIYGQVQYSGDYNVFLIKVDPLGNEDWLYTYDSGFDDNAKSAVCNDDGGFGIYGDFRNTGDYDFDLFFINVNSLGNEDWIYTYDAGFNDIAKDVVFTDDGSFIIFGHTQSSENSNLFVAKLDSLGNEEWFSTFYSGSSDYYFFPNKLIKTTNNSVAILAQSVDIGAAIDPNLLILMKINSDGGQDWNYVFDDRDYAYGVDLISTNDDSFVILSTISSYYIITKVDGLGNKQWDYNYSIGGSGIYGYGSLISTSNGGVVSLIGVRDPPNWWVGDSVFGCKIFFLKLDALGSIESSNNFGGYHQSPIVSSFGINSSDGGFVFISGNTAFGTYGCDSQIIIVKVDSEGNCIDIQDLPINTVIGV